MPPLRIELRLTVHKTNVYKTYVYKTDVLPLYYEGLY